MAPASRQVLLALVTSERLVRRPPGGERAAYRLASHYVAGHQRGDAVARVHKLAGERLACSWMTPGRWLLETCQSESTFRTGKGGFATRCGA
jgi:hypothetical protein